MTFNDILSHLKDEQISYEGESLDRFMQMLQDAGQQLPVMECDQDTGKPIEIRVVASANFPPRRTMPVGRLIGQMFGRKFFAQR